jgi:peroxiredoxin
MNIHIKRAAESSVALFLLYVCNIMTNRFMKRLLLILSCIFIVSSCIKDKPQGSDLKVGDMLPDFEVVMNDGTVVSDEGLAGSVSVVMFFHTSCPDCRQTLPRMQQIYDEYASEGVAFALISREDAEQDVEAYWNEQGLKMPYSAQNDRKVYEQFASSRIPRIYINDRNGIIRYIFTDDPVPSYDDMDSSVRSLIR